MRNKKKPIWASHKFKEVPIKSDETLSVTWDIEERISFMERIKNWWDEKIRGKKIDRITFKRTIEVKK